MTDDNLQPEQQPDGLEALVSKYVNDAIDNKVLPALDGIREQQKADMAKLFERVPNEEQVVGRIIDQLKAEAEEAASQHLQSAPGGDERAVASGNGQTSQSAPGGWEGLSLTDPKEMAALNAQLEAAKGEGPPQSGWSKKDVLDLLQAGLPLIDWTLNTGFRWKMMQQQLGSPFAYMQELYQRDPLMSQFLVTSWFNQFNPNIVQNQANAGAVGLMEGLKARGSALNTIVRSLAGVPGAPGSSPQNPLVLAPPSGTLTGPSSAATRPSPAADSPSGAPISGTGSKISFARNGGSGSMPKSSSDRPAASFSKDAVRS